MLAPILEARPPQSAPNQKGPEMSSLGIELPNQIARVRALRDEYITLRGMPNVIVEPQIANMEAEIDRATRAHGGGDVIAMLRAYESLKGYE